MKIEERLTYLEKQKLERLEQMRQKLLEAEQSFSFKPTISKASSDITKNRSNVIEINKNWAEQREQRLEAKRKQKEQEELSHLRMPELSQRTLKIIQQMKVLIFFHYRLMSIYRKEERRVKKLKIISNKRIRRDNIKSCQQQSIIFKILFLQHPKLLHMRLNSFEREELLIVYTNRAF